MTSGTFATRKPSNDLRFPKSSRILTRADFRRVYDQGTRLPSASFTAFILARPDLSRPRIGFTTPKALGNAVVRNRLRRRLREAVRLELPAWRQPFDVVFNARRSLLNTPFAALCDEIRKVFGQCVSY